VKVLHCSDDINEIVKLLTSAEFLELDPVFAGGFVHWLFELAYSKPRKAQETLRSIKATQKMYQLANLSSGYVSTKNQKFTKLNPFLFGDIDTWFLAANDIWDENGSYYPMINVNAHKEDIRAAGSHMGFNKLTHQSQWAHSFERQNRGDGYSDKLQIIVKPHNDIAEVLATFDLDGCRIAWHDGSFYLSDEFMNATRAREIVINDDHWNNAHHFQRVQTTIRAFKYYRRTGMALSKPSVDRVFQLYQDVVAHPVTQNNVVSARKGPIAVIANLFSGVLPSMNSKSAHMVSTYGGHNGRHNSKNVLERQHQIVISEFVSFMTQEHFDDTMLAFFVNSGIQELDDMVKVGMDYASGSRPKIKMLPLTSGDDFDFEF
jgi:hypothetical protein